MNLIKDIFFYNKEGDINIFKRLRINSGSKKATTDTSSKYFEGAHKPKNDWRSLSVKEYKTISSDSLLHFNKLISLHKLPLKLENLFRSLELTKCTTRKDVIMSFQSNLNAVKLINLELNRLILLHTNQEYKFNNISIIPKGLETSSSNFANNLGAEMKLLGLHIDRSEIFDIENTIIPSKNRIGLNLSNESRQFLFINLSVYKIQKMLKEQKKLDNLNIANLVDLYFQYYSDYPVISVLQKPYEYYIIPTDNVIHDGSTLDCSNDNILMSFLGYFNHKKKIEQ